MSRLLLTLTYLIEHTALICQRLSQITIHNCPLFNSVPVCGITRMGLSLPCPWIRNQNLIVFFIGHSALTKECL